MQPPGRAAAGPQGREEREERQERPRKAPRRPEDPPRGEKAPETLRGDTLSQLRRLVRCAAALARRPQGRKTHLARRGNSGGSHPHQRTDHNTNFPNQKEMRQWKPSDYN